MHSQSIKKIPHIAATDVGLVSKRLGAGRLGKTRSWKKAMVTLAEGETIEIFAS